MKPPVLSIVAVTQWMTLFQVIRVEITQSFQPALISLRRQGPHQAQTIRGIGEDPHHVGSPLRRPIEPLEHVG
jgi:hypothetical protein